MLISKTEFAKIAGVSTPAISKACKKGILLTAVCNGKIDTGSEACRQYLRKRNIDPSIALPKDDINLPIIPDKKPNGEQQFDFILPGADTDPKVFEEMTLVQLIEIFGTDSRFKDWTDARKRLTEIERNEIANAKSSGILVAKDLVKVGIIDPIDSVFARLLTDTAKTIAIRAEAMAKAGNDLDEIKSLVVDQISSVIKPAKSKIKRIFKNA